MANFAQTIVIGNLGSDPKLFNSDPNKPAFLTGSLAVDGKYAKRENGQVVVGPDGKKVYEKYTTWYNFKISGPRAVSFNQYHKKGDQVQLIGEMRMEKPYTTKLRPVYCYDANGQAIMDANGQPMVANACFEVKNDMYLRVNDWVFQSNKPADNTAYQGPVASPQAAPVAAPMAAPPVAPPTNAATPNTVAATFTGAAPQADPVAPQTNVAPQFSAPQGTMPDGV
jgi:hypothetical protein